MLLDIACKILREGPVCDHCLGRQFAKLSTGLSNEQRGGAVRLVLEMEAQMGDSRSGEEFNSSMTEDSAEDSGCWVCGNLFEELEDWVERCLQALDGVEFGSFLVGTRLSGLLSENEEVLWEVCGTRFAEPLKSEVNREVGKRLQARTGKEVDFRRPDVVLLLDLAGERVEVNINPVFLYGRYRKLVRGIPQTRWPCRECRGRGCPRCNFKGKLYPESVDEIIRTPLLREFKARDTVFHGAGREDVDALMLGEGRPFVVEIVQPRIRRLDWRELRRLEEEISSSGKVEVEGFQFVSREMVLNLKSERRDKTYSVLVSFEGEVDEEKLKSVLAGLRGKVRQKTPRRVLARRADLEREREVYYMELTSLAGDRARILVNCEGGLYVKELVSGDSGRTNPSLSERLGMEAKVIELEVIKA